MRLFNHPLQARGPRARPRGRLRQAVQPQRHVRIPDIYRPCGAHEHAATGGAQLRASSRGPARALDSSMRHVPGRSARPVLPPRAGGQEQRENIADLGRLIQRRLQRDPARRGSGLRSLRHGIPAQLPAVGETGREQGVRLQQQDGGG